MKSILFACIWLIFNVSLVVWWTVLGVRRDPHTSWMILSEGAFLVFSLFAGGLALLILILREQRRTKSLREFYAAFSHELKTPIASLRLQVESLMDAKGEILAHRPVMQRLFSDSVRLEHQLENALAMGEVESGRFFYEKVKISQLLDRAKIFWTSLEIVDQTENFEVSADRRALERIFNNLIQNAILHAQAKTLTVKKINERTLKVYGDGLAFTGDLSRLGYPFYRQSKTSGSGVGTFLIKEMMNKMGGKAHFQIASNSIPVLECVLTFADEVSP